MRNYPNSRFSNRRILFLLVSTFLLGILLSFAYLRWCLITGKLYSSNENEKPKAPPLYEIKRLTGYRFISPVVAIAPKEASAEFQEMENELVGLIDRFKSNGMASAVSLYFEKLNTGEWMGIQEDEAFHPASLLKVPLMIAVLKMVESNPSMLKQSFMYEVSKNKDDKVQYFKPPHIEAGKEYTLHELIYYMAAYSDNHAARMLSCGVDTSIASRIFQDFGITLPYEAQGNVIISAKAYSNIINSIFNSTYLSPEYAEYAAEMLFNCIFKEGFGKGLPDSVKVWHKFGEWRDHGVEDELHESGVIYINNMPFLLTIMTRGKDPDTLAGVIAEIAKHIFDSVVSRS